MRADRLVAVLLLLQARGRVTAAEVAAELEVSERTARRDLDALAMAGVPVTSTRGRHGGWELVGRGRTDLSGLTAPEARALFLLAGPASATPEVRAALRKLLRALPEPLRVDAERAAGAVVVDPAGWDRAAPLPDPPALATVQGAVVARRRLRLRYEDRERRGTERVVHPLGVVAKGSTWYLVAGTDAGRRTFRLDRIRAATVLDEPAERPDGFDLAEAWRAIAADIDRRRTPLRVHLRVAHDAVGLCRMVLGDRLEVGPRAADGRYEAELRGHGVDAVAGELAGLGDRVEVLDPPELRAALAAIGRTLVARYAPTEP